MKTLTFDTLRRANAERLPLFKNSKGFAAHSKADGSDWSRSDWLEAITGELGEYANKSKKFRRGDISQAEFLVEAEKELADVVTYIDILAAQLGVDLGEAIRKKFNEVSTRVGAPVYISDCGEVVRDAQLIEV
jgi:NTP pyrophosphatase (non-canonical NTP hydrolase)